MSRKYRDQLARLKENRNNLDSSHARIENMYGHLMSDSARMFNNEHRNIERQYYDRQIQQLEALAQKELEEEIIGNILKGLSDGSKGAGKEIASNLSSEINKTLKEIGFR